MLSRFLIDTNILIYYFNGLLDNDEIHTIFAESFNISIISKIEFLSWNKLLKNNELQEKAKTFISYANVIELDNNIADKTITLRQKYNLKTPDAIILATSINNNLTLLTNDKKDFNHISVNIKNIEI
jgi:predicted nucleic acid-binding protein